jgi:hypothetical protein
VINAGETAPQTADRTLGNFTANYTPLSWLKVDYSLGADFTAEDRLEARPEQASGTPVGGGWCGSSSTTGGSTTTSRRAPSGSGPRT